MPEIFDPTKGQWKRSASGGTPGAHNHTPAEIVPQGAGSGLDADFLDGLSSAAFAAAAHNHDAGEITTGTLVIARGGTNSGTALGAFNNLSPLTTRGDLLTRDAANNVRLGVGVANRILGSNGTDPSWRNVAAADFANQTANTLLGGPTSGGAAAPTFRELVPADFADPLLANCVLATPNLATGKPTFRPLVEADLPSLTSLEWRVHCTDETGTGKWVFADAPTLNAPVIADFTSAQHDHLDADDGGTLTVAAISNLSTVAYLRDGTVDMQSAFFADRSSSPGVDRLWKADSTTHTADTLVWINPFVLGGTLYGGTSTGSISSDNLTLMANQAAHAAANTGRIQLDDRVTLWPSLPDDSGNVDVLTFSPAVTYAANVAMRAIRMQPAFTLNTGAGIVTFNALEASPTFTVNVTNPIITFALFSAAPTFTLNSSILALAAETLADTATLDANNVAAGTIGEFMTVRSQQTVKATGASGSITVTAWSQFVARGNITTTAGGGAATVTTRRGLHVVDITKSGAGTETLTNNIGVDVDNLAAGGTLNHSIRTGTASCSWGGKFTTYNAVATVSDGIAYEVATVALTAQGANIGNTTLYAVPAAGAGLYRISVFIQVTRAATTSSTMPAVRIDWTDPDASATPADQQVTPTDAGNTTVTYEQATFVVNAKASTNIVYDTTGFASSGATSMQYALRIRVEALGA